ncbi:MAG: hypothetical protein KGY76_07065 [Candidatus Thermoplasmatota archaeon]|nr:hypothetical protein [Candidatus Thermoplasmatota archaeon]
MSGKKIIKLKKAKSSRKKTRSNFFSKRSIGLKKSIALLTVIILVFSSLNAAIYISVNTRSSLDVSEDIDSLQFMAADWNHEGDRVLQKEGDRYKLDLGEWPAGESKTYPAAFAIVNPSDRDFSLTDISLIENPGNLKMHIHSNMTRPCNEDVIDLEKNETEKELIYEKDSEDPIDFNWTLSSGSGYKGDELIYSNKTEEATAAKENGTWVHNRTGPVVAERGEANFVWVEMSVFSHGGDEEVQHRGPIQFEIEGDFEPESGPNVAFMGSGRRDGGPVVRALEGNTIELNVTGLKENTTVVIPDAIAIVNAGPTELNVTDITVGGDAEGYMQVWLHSSPYKPAGDYGLGVERDENRTEYHPSNENNWSLDEGFGYSGENENLVYGKEGDKALANRTAGRPDEEYNLWMYDESANNLAEEGTSNFVWVEVAYVVGELPEGTESVDVHSTLDFQFSTQ